ncbi:ribonuclease inhibitor-like [Sardina pilchardus]|uniref:ribonuclease inhibitor-like n=1 Tax=Sardina pilchardus TaxID=27697 RepID=UPI002E14A0D0
MRVLGLGGSKATDSQVKHLSSLLENPSCKLEILDLTNCSIGEEGFTALASALRSNPSHMRKLWLKGSKATDSGVKHLSSLLEDPSCKLEILELAGCKLTEKSCELVASVLLSPNSLIELDLSENNLGYSGVQLLSKGLSNPLCRLQTLRLTGCKLTEKSCEHVASVLQSPNSLMELDLKDNELTDSGAL